LPLAERIADGCCIEGKPIFSSINFREGIVMTVNPLYLLALAGCATVASVYAIRRQSRIRRSQKQEEELDTWEGEGGKPALPGAKSTPVA
jgi:hypothetical protein